MFYSKPLGLVILSNEHAKCNLSDDDEQTRKNNDSFTNLINLETIPNSNGKLMYHKMKQILRANKIAKTSSISEHMPRNKKTTKHVYMTKIQDTPKNKCSICEQLQFEKNMNYITQELEIEYQNLLQNDKEIMNKKICTSCKREIQNGKLP